jgi:hypothetical protein
MLVTAEKREWYAFLDTIAPQVNKLIIEQRNLRVFREKIAPFAAQWEIRARQSRMARHRIRHSNRLGPPATPCRTPLVT